MRQMLVICMGLKAHIFFACCLSIPKLRSPTECPQDEDGGLRRTCPTTGLSTTEQGVDTVAAVQRIRPNPIALSA